MFNITKKELIAFETKIVNLFKQGKLPYLLHLCGGNEDLLIDIFKEINTEDYIFSTHRSHYHYLLAGGNQETLINKICKGNSMFVFDKSINFLSSSILAGTACIAAGTALALKLKQSKQKVWCFIGDGAEDQGHFYEAVRYVDNLGLPCTYIIEDNNRSVESTKEMRSSKNTINWPSCVIRYTYIPTYPHAGPGLLEMIEFDKETIKQYKNKCIIK